MKNNRASYLLKNTLLFTLGNLGTKFISFFLIPLYTNALTTEQYGVVDLVTTVVTIAFPILSLNVAESVMRFNLDKDADQNKITKIGLTVLFLGSVVGLILIPICGIFDQVADMRFLVYLYTIFSAITQVLLYDLRGKEMLLHYSLGHILQTALIAVFNILFLLVFKWETRGYLLAYILAFAIVAIYALIVGKGYKAIRVPIDRRKMREMLQYSIVLIPNSFMWWIMNSSDHIMVTAMIGTAANGIYAVSYKLPTLITTFTSIFNQAWSYSAIREENAEDEEQYSNYIFKMICFITLLVGTVMLAVIKPFLKIYVSADYFEAWKYTPFLIVGLVFLTFASFMSTSYTVHKDSFGFLFSGIFGAVMNIVLNFILIPFIGVYGAALATCVSYIAVFIFRAIHTRKYIRYNVLNKEFIIGVVMLIASAILIFQSGIIAQIALILLPVGLIIVYKDIWSSVLKDMLKKKKH